MFCPECGREITGDRKFCAGCGFNVGGPPSLSSPAGAQAPVKPKQPPQQPKLPQNVILPRSKQTQQVQQGLTRQAAQGVQGRQLQFRQPPLTSAQSPSGQPPQQLQQHQQAPAAPQKSANKVVPGTPQTARPSHLDFQIPPPPGQPGQTDSKDMQIYPDEPPPGEFTPYTTAKAPSSFTITYDPKGLTIFGVIMLILMCVGVPAVQYVASGTSGFPIQGFIESEKHLFSIYVPEGWSSVKDPQLKTGHVDAAAYYFKGNSRNPDIVSIIYSIPGNSDFPRFLSHQDLQTLEPILLDMNEQYMEALGMKYELLELKTFMMDGDHSVWMDGNAMKRGRENKRDFTFLAFRSSRTYIIKFMFDEIRVDEFWPEIESMLDSIEFR